MKLKQLIKHYGVRVEPTPNGKFYQHKDKKIYQSNDKRVTKREEEIIEELEDLIGCKWDIEKKQYTGGEIIFSYKRKAITIKKTRKLKKSEFNQEWLKRKKLHKKIDPLIVELYNQNKTFQDIADELNIPKNKVSSRIGTMVALGTLKRRDREVKLPNEKLDEIFRLSKQGLTRAQIAYKVKLSQAKISRTLAKYKNKQV